MGPLTLRMLAGLPTVRGWQSKNCDLNSPLGTAVPGLGAAPALPRLDSLVIYSTQLLGILGKWDTHSEKNA